MLTLPLHCLSCSKSIASSVPSDCIACAIGCQLHEASGSAASSLRLRFDRLLVLCCTPILPRHHWVSSCSSTAHQSMLLNKLHQSRAPSAARRHRHPKCVAKMCRTCCAISNAADASRLDPSVAATDLTDFHYLVICVAGLKLPSWPQSLALPALPLFHPSTPALLPSTRRSPTSRSRLCRGQSLCSLATA